MSSIWINGIQAHRNSNGCSNRSKCFLLLYCILHAINVKYEIRLKIHSLKTNYKEWKSHLLFFPTKITILKFYIHYFSQYFLPSRNCNICGIFVTLLYHCIVIVTDAVNFHFLRSVIYFLYCFDFF